MLGTASPFLSPGLDMPPPSGLAALGRAFTVAVVLLLSVVATATHASAQVTPNASLGRRAPRVSPGAADVWTCEQLLQKDVARVGSGIVWRRLRCANPGTPVGAIGPMVFNTVTVNLTAPGVRVTGGRSTPPGEQGSDGLQPLQEMALNVPDAVAGINGGYFYRTDTSSFVDFVRSAGTEAARTTHAYRTHPLSDATPQVRRGKTLADAKQPPSPAHPNDGIGDGILIINGSSVSYNCDLPGYSVPVSLVLDGPQSYFQIQSRGGVLPPGTRNALGRYCALVACCRVSGRWGIASHSTHVPVTVAHSGRPQPGVVQHHNTPARGVHPT